MTAPRLARWLLSRIIGQDDRDFFLGDLEEEYREHALLQGKFAARVWYWRQTAFSALPLARRRVGARTNLPATAGDPMWRDVISDVRYTMRLSRRSPLASIAVALTMVLGIGVTTAVFSVVDGVLLKPLPFAAANRTVQLGFTLRDGRDVPTMSYPLMQDFRRDTRAFAAFASASSNTVTLTQGDVPTQLSLTRVDEGYATVFGVQALLGRYFANEEFRYGGEKVVLLSNAFWRRQFGGDRAIVGKSLSLNNEPYAVIGVLPPMAYQYPENETDVFAPLVLKPGSDQLSRSSFWLQTVAVLKPGMTVGQGQADIAAMEQHIALQFPTSGFSNIKIKITPLLETVVGNVRPVLVLLSASVAAVLLIACVNIANLLLGRSHARAREFVVRAALGASRGRLRRQLLTESMLLSAVGGAIGLALAPVMTHVLLILYPDKLPRLNEIGVDIRVLAFAVVATMAAGLLSGIPMARRATGTNLSRDLRHSGRLAGGMQQNWVGATLIVSQVAMSVTLLFAAGLLLRTFFTMSQIDPGFRPAQVVTFHVFPTPAKYPDNVSVANYYRDVEQALLQIAGVRSVATGTDVPLDDDHTSIESFVDKVRGNLAPANPSVRATKVSHGYLEILGVPVLRGRAFGVNDNERAPKVVVINEALAQKVYPGEESLGRIIEWDRAEWQIVGVIGNVRPTHLWEAPTPTLYAPTAQHVERDRYVLVNSALRPDQLLPQLRAALSRIDATIPLTGVTTMPERFAMAVAPQRFRAALVGGLGVLALALSTLGIYGVVAAAVGRQTREIGIRMALGEAAMHVQKRVVLNALRTAITGALLGVAGALVVGRGMSDLLVGVSPRDPVVLSAVSVLLMGIASVAAYVPARRASRIDPSIALRGE